MDISKKQKIRTSKNIILLAITIALTGFIVFIKLRPSNNKKPIPVSSCQGLISDKDFTIKLISRQFLPEAEIISGTSWLKQYSGDRVHVLIQLCEPTNSSTKSMLEKSGVKFLNYIPENSWFASIPKSLANDSFFLSAIRWFAPILPEDKFSSSTLQKDSLWALRDGNKIALEISFFEDVNLQDAEILIKKLDGKVIGSTPISNKLTIELSRKSIQVLAENDSVRWIDVVPPPPVTDVER